MSKDLFDKVDRDFIKLWLSKISEANILISSDTADPTTLSFFCQLAAMACLEETGLMPQDTNLATDFSMNFVKKLWPIIPIGAKRTFGTEGWMGLQYLQWRDPNAAWHNLFVPTARSEFKTVLEKIYSEFPLLSEEDCQELVALSPVLQVLEREPETRPSYLRYLDYHFLDTFHNAQVESRLGSIPESDATIEKFTKFIGNGMKGTFPQIMQSVHKAYPLVVAHRTRFASPPESSHETVLEKLILSSLFSQVWRETLDKVEKDGNNPSEFREFVLKCTFLSSYQAAHQLMNSQEFIRASSKRGPGWRATSDLKFWIAPDLPATGQVTMALIFQIVEYYHSTFPFLDDNQVGMLLYRNPLYIYLTLLCLEGTHAIEGITPLDDGDSWDE